MKRLVDLRRFTHGELRGEQRVEAAAKAMERNLPLGRERDALTSRVHAGIRARRTGDADLVLDDLRERLLEVLLHGRAVQLALPAVETGAVVLDDQTDEPHALCVSEVRGDAERAGVLTVARAVVEQERGVVAEGQPQRRGDPIAQLVVERRAERISEVEPRAAGELEVRREVARDRTEHGALGGDAARPPQRRLTAECGTPAELENEKGGLQEQAIAV